MENGESEQIVKVMKSKTEGFSALNSYYVKSDSQEKLDYKKCFSLL